MTDPQPPQTSETPSQTDSVADATSSPVPEPQGQSQDPLVDALAELANLKAANADLADQYLRAKAEVENARRRADEEVSKARKFAVEAFAESLLPVADSLSAGLAIADATAEQLREGSEATLRQLKTALERHKV
ncbi:MAG: nucleotide exchange factor GrpE, partial [Limnohabitans sp.]